jgi:drug/metabolite transporter (DMT)-like permease
MAYVILGEIPTLAQYLGGSLLLVGVIISFIGNSYQSKINRESNKSSAIEKMDTPTGFRGI